MHVIPTPLAFLSPTYKHQPRMEPVKLHRGLDDANPIQATWWWCPQQDLARQLAGRDSPAL